MHDLVIGGNFTIPGYASYSGQGKAESGEYDMVIGKSGRTWLYHPEESSCYVSGEKGSRGFGGSTLRFKLRTGGTIDLTGPWASNADALFKDTGVDVRNNFITWGCVGTGRNYDANSGLTKLTGVKWFDAEPTKGDYDRIDYIAWEMQKASDEPLYYYRESEGGSSHGPVSMPYKMRVEKGIQKEIDW